MPEKFAFWARRSTAQGSKPKEVCWYMCRAGRQQEAERATGEERSGSKVSAEPSQGMHLPSSKAGPSSVSVVRKSCLFHLWAVTCLLTTAVLQEIPSRLHKWFHWFLFLHTQMLLQQLRICVHGKAAALHKQQKNFNLNSKANFGGLVLLCFNIHALKIYWYK